MTEAPLIFVCDGLQDLGVSPYWATVAWRLTALLVVLALGVLAEILLRRVVVRGLKRLAERSKATWDKILFEAGVVNRLSLLLPTMLVYRLLEFFYPPEARFLSVAQTVARVVLILLAVLTLDALLNACLRIYYAMERANKAPIKGFTQVGKIVLYFVAIILVFAAILDRSPVFLFSGLGALTAVLMLIFKDAILGFVAGIQLTANKMVTLGDWIEMPRYGADGDVVDIALTTVKVQNWDRTITTIPTYALISDSFKNWQGMSESGGRRIMRSIAIDVNTITFCSEEDLRRYAKIQYIQDYLDAKKAEIETFNATTGADVSCPVNGRRLTNVGTFRAYIVAYLRNHPQINLNMVFLVRQLEPTANGLPIQIYVFCKDKVWANYESIQADIFDHILAVVPEFDLRLFQAPCGGDFQALIATSAREQAER